MGSKKKKNLVSNYLEKNILSDTVKINGIQSSYRPPTRLFKIAISGQKYSPVKTIWLSSKQCKKYFGFSPPPPPHETRSLRLAMGGGGGKQEFIVHKIVHKNGT